jgi:hypothetical protein
MCGGGSNRPPPPPPPPEPPSKEAAREAKKKKKQKQFRDAQGRTSTNKTTSADIAAETSTTDRSNLLGT